MADLRMAVTLVLLLVVLAFAPALVGALPAPTAAAPAAEATKHAPGIVLVGMRGGGEQGATGDLFAEAGAQEVPGQVRIVRAIPGIGVQVVQVPPGQEEAWLARLRADPRVAFAELDHRLRAAGPAPLIPMAGDSSGGEGGIIPNDPAWSTQWGLATLRVAEAWQKGTGSPDVVIAIVDTGVATEHPDLEDKLWINAGEIAGNGLDDDGNGKADDVHGWHFYHLYSSGTYEAAEDAAIADDHGHGTHVAGIAAAATNNGIGVAGVSWGAKIMAVKMLDRYGDGWYSDAAAAVIYAADNGARVINLSLGGEEVSATLCAAIEYAHSRGCLVVAAAGNSGGSVLYPAACAQALAVAATTSADERATYSNHGPEVDLSAPGSSIYSTWPWLDGYFTLSGTSMAAAHVSGVAALVWSRWPVLGPDGVMQQLTRTAVDIDATGSDPYTGWGRIDAATATGSLRVEQLVFIPLCVGNLTNP